MYELIVYLEPTSETPLRNCLDRFLLETAPSYYSSTAVKYPPHVSVTGFFKAEDQAELDTIITAYDQTLSTITTDPPTIGMTPIVVPNKPSKHLLLPVTVPTPLHSLLTQCANNQKTHIRSKRMDHISLAYWDEPQATSLETEAWLAWCNGPQMEKMIQDLVENLGFVDGTACSWTIALYERTRQGVAIGEKHQFKELYRWLIS